MDRKPLIVSPYDTELFGHWWFEGPDFLLNVFREINRSDVIKPITPSEYLNEYPTNQILDLNPSSWGDKGYYEVWLNGENDWIYRHILNMGEIFTDFARKYKDTNDNLKRRVLNQMARELVLAQSSDWAFLITTGTAVEYAKKRTKEHIYNFMRLKDFIEDGYIDENFLQKLEFKHSIFADADLIHYFY
jgi:1,4-alpha-glucan branching enzyme